MPIYADTDGRLDRCAECGAAAGFEPGRKEGQRLVTVRCTECCNTGGWAFVLDTETVAATIMAWNIAQRKTKGGV